MNKIPVNIITGHLGVGKTTAILHLLKQKPTDEQWVILVNDFGEVSIDHLTLSANANASLQVVAVEGGCICCSAADEMYENIRKIIHQLRPQRLLIEPTGMGHPASILDMLRTAPFASEVCIEACICLVNPAQLCKERFLHDGTYLDQLSLADVLLANKTDLCNEEALDFFWEYAEELYPPKWIIDRVQQAQIKPEWLYLSTDESRMAQYPTAHQHETPRQSTPLQSVLLQQIPRVGKPIRKPSKGLGSYTCGWIFSPKEIFDLNKLNQLVVRLYLENHIHRAKGIFRTGEDWYVYNCVEGMPSTHDVAYRRDSRLELIATENIDWKALETSIMECIL